MGPLARRARPPPACVPWQPASTSPYVGSSRIAKSAASQSGWLALISVQPVALGLDLLAVVEQVGHVEDRGSAR